MVERRGVSRPVCLDRQVDAAPLAILCVRLFAIGIAVRTVLSDKLLPLLKRCSPSRAISANTPL
jgi:hypothetical protein